jgi:lipopolysaccharide/colanic/teichoic acid biosynthesis glycosyltransferase
MRRKFGKRVLDLVLAIPGAILLSPFLGLIAIIVKLDSSGPVFYCQERLGHFGKIFQVLKFRTMYMNAPDRGVVVKNVENDPRVTKVGAFLRRWSLDELPQLWNVIKGEMSLVGPRPDRVFRLPEYTERRKRRLLMKPGITGLAQINGRNAIPWQERYELDVAYVDNWSLQLDAKILIKTLGVVFNGFGVDYE